MHCMLALQCKELMLCLTHCNSQTSQLHDVVHREWCSAKACACRLSHSASDATCPHSLPTARMHAQLTPCMLQVARMQSTTAKAEGMPPQPLTSRSSQEALSQAGTSTGLHGASRLSGAAEPSPLRAAMLNSSQQQQQHHQSEPSTNLDTIRGALPDHNLQQPDAPHLSTIAESGPEAATAGDESAPLLSSISIQPRATDPLAPAAHPESSAVAGHAASHRLKQTSGIPPDILSEQELMPHLASGGHLPHEAATDRIVVKVTANDGLPENSQTASQVVPPQLRPLLVPRPAADSRREQAQSSRHMSGRAGASSSSASATRPRQPRVSDMDT